jgi:hypothetical protein
MGGGTSPLTTGGGMSGSQTQLPSFAMPQQQPTQTQTQTATPGALDPSQFMHYGRQQPNNFSLAHGPNTFEGQQTVGRFGNAQYRPPSMQNPFQPQQPSFMQDPEYQGYQTQANDLQRQMDEYMRKAPMYQQLQDLQGKMAPFQQRQAMQQRQFQQPSPFRRGQYQQPMGQQGFMGGRGMSQPRMSMDMPETMYEPRMSMDMPEMMYAQPARMPRNAGLAGLFASFPQNFGREQRYSVPAYSADYSGMGSATRAALAAEAAQAAQASAPAYDPYASGYSSGW